MVVEWTAAKSLVDAMESGIINRNGVALAKKNDGLSPIQDRWRLLYRSPCGCDYCTGCRLAPPPPPPPPPRCSSCNFAPKPPPPPPPSCCCGMCGK
ncbi:hypothetical protein AVEN_223894-1 [Araneus ventricosus]|uniref:Uncharacterized protein n=1 Tax=Araneus ventricosus TaxID=182803 RepID=A0A4Y2PIC7_ARAVE|nr:hypothetical protein AVEN_223894-1 [Araneus ventricosus]